MRTQPWGRFAGVVLLVASGCRGGPASSESHGPSAAAATGVGAARHGAPATESAAGAEDRGDAARFRTDAHRWLAKFTVAPPAATMAVMGTDEAVTLSARDQDAVLLSLAAKVAPPVDRSRSEPEEGTSQEWVYATVFLHDLLSSFPCILEGKCRKPVCQEDDGATDSFGYDLDRCAVRVNPRLFRRQAAAARLQTDSRDYAELIYGSVAHELGHWFAAEVERSIVGWFRDNYDREFAGVRQDLWWEELFSDYHAGKVLAHRLQSHEPLQRFFRANDPRAGYHPPASLRVRAVTLGLENGGRDHVAAADQAALLAALGGGR